MLLADFGALYVGLIPWFSNHSFIDTIVAEFYDVMMTSL